MIREEDKIEAIRIYTEMFKSICDEEGYISGLIMAKDLAKVIVDSLKPSTSYMVMDYKNLFSFKYKPITNVEVVKTIKANFNSAIDKLYLSIEKKSTIIQLQAINEILFTTNLVIVNAGLHWLIQDLFYAYIEFKKDNDNDKYVNKIKEIINNANKRQD